MAQLKNLIVNGASRFIGDIYTSSIYTNQVQLTTLIAPSSSNGTTYNTGTNGQLVKSNGNSIYWTTLEASDIPNLNASKITAGTIDVARLPAMGAATASAAGTAGLVPAPAKGKQTSFLRGDGTWVVPTPADLLGTSGTTGKFWRGDNSWSNTLEGGLTLDGSLTLGVEDGNSNYSTILMRRLGLNYIRVPAATGSGIAFAVGDASNANNTYVVINDEGIKPAQQNLSLGIASNVWANIYATTFHGNATSATQLAATGTVQVNVASNSAVTYTSGGNITPGITGVLPINNGGTNASNSLDALTNLGGPSINEANLITASMNLNTYLTPGSFAPNTHENAQTILARPVDTGFKLWVIKNYANNYLHQVALNRASVGVYMRVKSGSSAAWQSWYRTAMIKSANTQEEAEANTATWAAVGSTTTPVFVNSSGVVTALNYTIEKSVPSNAAFTDTKVNFTLDTSSKAYLMACTSAPTSTTTAREAIGDTSVYISNHTLYATSIDTNSLNINDVANISSLGNMSIANLEVSSTSFGTTSKHYGHIDTGTLQLISEEDDRYIFIEPPSSSAVALNTFLRADGNWSNVIETSNKLKTTAATNATKMFILGQSTAGTGQDTYIATANTSGSANKTGIYFQGSTGVLMGAAWNDYAEFRQSKENKKIEPGKVVYENGDDSLSVSTKRLMRGCSIISDTYGFGIGESEEAQLPIAVSGRVLAYPYENREKFKQHIGWPVCSGPNGTVSIMTEEEEEKYPSRIIGIISAIPDYEIWHGGTDVVVNGRVWIKVR